VEGRGRINQRVRLMGDLNQIWEDPNIGVEALLVGTVEREDMLKRIVGSKETKKTSLK
ncbi:hypothetical protein KI387_041205, partial [Taxus chinensis]